MAMAAAAPHLYLDGKWKQSKKETSNSSSLSRSRSPSSSSCSSSSLIKNSSQRRCAFTRKCAALVKEQRARFYIMRRVRQLMDRNVRAVCLDAERPTLIGQSKHGK